MKSPRRRRTRRSLKQPSNDRRRRRRLTIPSSESLVSAPRIVHPSVLNWFLICCFVVIVATAIRLRPSPRQRSRIAGPRPRLSRKSGSLITVQSLSTKIWQREPSRVSIPSCTARWTRPISPTTRCRGRCTSGKRWPLNPVSIISYLSPFLNRLLNWVLPSRLLFLQHLVSLEAKISISNLGAIRQMACGKVNLGKQILVWNAM